METQQPQKETHRRLWLVLLAVLIILIATMSLFVLLRNGPDQQPRTASPRPLVLIHHPIKNTQFEIGDGIIIHTSAKHEGGLSRLELWADDVLVAAVDKLDQSSSNMVLSHVWIPHLPGGHVLIARAIGQDKTQGQASIDLIVVEPAELSVSEHPVQEGETLESIAADYGLVPGDLAALNPDIETEVLSPGDTLTLPDDEPVGREPAPRSEENAIPLEPEHPAPIPEAEPPAGILSASDFQSLSFMERLRSEPADPIGVKVELLSLETHAAYEGLYCYIGLGDQPSNRYPDIDLDPTTDEWFLMDESSTRETALWLVAGLLENENAPLAFWPQDQALPFNIACVGITDGGLESARLGRWEGEISPERWTGIPMELGASGVDGWFKVTIRLTRPGSTSRGVPLYLDPDMVSPTNARLDSDRVSLRWDFLIPEPEEPIDDVVEIYPIDGFRIYLNGNLLWVEPPNARESFLPIEWFHPPCGTTYIFAVTAFRVGLPDGPESIPAVTSLEQPLEGCHREIQITFLTLETFELDGDGRRPEHHDDVGPVYGFFYANEQQVLFDTRSPGGGGRLDLPNGLNRNSYYNLLRLSRDPGWHFSGSPILIVEVPPDGAFEYGYVIMDQDYGRCRRPSDPGCDDVICNANERQIGSSSSLLDLYHEHGLISENGLCLVTIQWGPAFGSPVGSGVPGEEPLPWIHVEDVRFDEGRNSMQIQIRNTGTGAWSRRDLTMELQTREGVSLNTTTFHDFTLEAGARITLGPAWNFEGQSLDGCILIDPFDEVLELGERSFAVHSPICPQLPDLTITGVDYDPSGTGRLRVTVQNTGPGKLSNRTLTFKTLDTDGNSLYVSGSWPNVSLEPNEARSFDLIGANQRIREQMQAGYSVVINQDRTIIETNYDNNTFTITPYNLQLAWCDGFIPHYHGQGSTARMFLTAEVVTSSTSRTILEAARSNTLTRTEANTYGYNHCFEQGCTTSAFSCRETSPMFSILSDEVLRISLTADFKAGSIGRFNPLGSHTTEIKDQQYRRYPIIDDGERIWTGYCPRYYGHGLGGMFSPPNWWSQVCIAQVSP